MSASKTREVEESFWDRCNVCGSFRFEADGKLLPEVVVPRHPDPDKVDQWICEKCENKGLGMK